jgi:endonuclease YncB( thermonuclease family)
VIALAAALFVFDAGFHTAGAQPRVSDSDCRPLAVVTRVFDGDTVLAPAIGRVRLLGIDAPEMGGPFDRPAPFAMEARERLASLVLNRWVRLECDGTRVDAYGRRLFYVLLETGDFVNAVLVRSGLARVSARSSLRRLDELRRAEVDAQSRRRGMWGERPRLPLR